MKYINNYSEPITDIKDVKYVKGQEYQILSSLKNAPFKVVVERLDSFNNMVYVGIPFLKMHDIPLYNPMYDYRNDMLSFYPIKREFYAFAEKNGNKVNISDRSFIPDIFTSLQPYTKIPFTVYKIVNGGCICEVEFEGVKCRAFSDNIDNIYKEGDTFISPMLIINNSTIVASQDPEIWKQYINIVKKNPKRTLKIYNISPKGCKAYEMINNGNDKITLFIPNVIMSTTKYNIGDNINVEVDNIDEYTSIVTFKRN